MVAIEETSPEIDFPRLAPAGAFVAAHFIAMFSWSNLGPVMAIKGAEGLGALDLPRPALLVSLLLISLVFDLFIGSASANCASAAAKLFVIASMSW